MSAIYRTIADVFYVLGVPSPVNTFGVAVRVAVIDKHWAVFFSIDGPDTSPSLKETSESPWSISVGWYVSCSTESRVDEVSDELEIYGTCNHRWPY